MGADGGGARCKTAKSGAGGGFGSAGGFGPSMAEEASQWRRTGPLPAREPAMGGARGGGGRYDDAPRGGGGGFGGSGGGFDASERDWSAARGAKFTPAGPSASGGFAPREPRERDAGFAPREDGPSMADLPDDWRGNRPARAAPPPSSGPAGGMMGGGGYQPAPHMGGGPERERGMRSGGFGERDQGVAGPAETEAVVRAA